MDVLGKLGLEWMGVMTRIVVSGIVEIVGLMYEEWDKNDNSGIEKGKVGYKIRIVGLCLDSGIQL